MQPFVSVFSFQPAVSIGKKVKDIYIRIVTGFCIGLIKIMSLSEVYQQNEYFLRLSLISYSRKSSLMYPVFFC